MNPSVERFSGVFTALVTPFRNGEVDYESLKSLVRFQLENGIQGFVVCGTTAESPTLNDVERLAVFKCVKEEVAGRVPLVMGTGTNCTRETIRLTVEAEKMGADAALVVVPYYNRPPQRGLVAHYTAVANAAPNLPILLYNVPSRTIAKLEIDSIAKLSKVNNIIGIKEATGDISFTRQIVEVCGPDFLITSGDDATYLQLVEAGGHGIISVASHILPREFVRWLQKIQSGHTNAHSEMAKFLGLISQLYVEPNPIPVKTALAILGVIQSPEMRLPLMQLEAPLAAELKAKMNEVGIL